MEVLQYALPTNDLRQRQKLKRYIVVGSCGAKQSEELPSRVLERRIRHVIYERDAKRWRRRTMASNANRRFPSPRFRYPPSLQHQWHDYASCATALRPEKSVEACAKAWPRSSRISSMCSMPTLKRIISGVTPTFACSSGESCRWVVEAG